MDLPASVWRNGTLDATCACMLSESRRRLDEVFLSCKRTAGVREAKNTLKKIALTSSTHLFIFWLGPTPPIMLSSAMGAASIGRELLREQVSMFIGKYCL